MHLAPAAFSDVTAGDARRISVAQVLVYELRVRDAMTKPPITAAPTDSLRMIQDVMRTRRISGVPITAGDALLGIVSIEDIIKALTSTMHNLCECSHTRCSRIANMPSI